MDVRQVLDDFAKYIDYDPNRKSFNLLSNDWQFHQAGEKIEKLLSGYDPSGMLSVVYARQVFLECAKDCRISMYDYLVKEEAREDVRRGMEMYQELNHPAIKGAEDAYIDEIGKLVQQVTGKTMIGERDLGAEKDVFFSSVVKVVEDLGKCHVDVFRKGGRVTIRRAMTRIQVFERMADCLLQLEKSPDALYFCYINQNYTADEYFAFVIKSNGTVFSVSDRVDEEYIGQHAHCRNARWSEKHADKIFPYDHIFQYGKHDYKGYATEYMIDEDKLDLMALGPQVYQPILAAMALLKNKYEGQEAPGEPIYLNTLMESNYLEEHPGTSLVELGGSGLMEWNNSYSCGLDLKRAVSGGYNEKFHMQGEGSFWASLYGGGFEPDLTGILSSMGPARLLGDKGSGKPYAEFLGDAEKMDREVYRKIRIQLARHIREKLEQEYDSFGGKEGAEGYWLKEMEACKDKAIDLFCQAYYLKSHPGETGEMAQGMPEVAMKEGERFFGAFCLNGNTEKDGWRTTIVDDKDGHKCSIFFLLSFSDCKQMEAFIGKALPKIFQGWDSRGSLGYNGNSILDATDAVGEIVSPLYGGKRPSNGREYEGCHFNAYMGFSKSTWRKTYESWLMVNGLGSEVARMKAVKKAAILAEKNKPVPAYCPLDESWEKYANYGAAEKLNQELYGICPESSITGCSLNGREIKAVYAWTKEKGNQGKLQELWILGWEKSFRYKESGGYYVRISKEVK